MARDFRAKQVRTSIIIGSGSIESTKPHLGLAFYSGSQAANHDGARIVAGTVISITVTIASNKFVFDGANPSSLTMHRGLTYKFNVSHASNTGHELKFSVTKNGTHNAGAAYATGYTNGSTTPGTADAYVQLVVAADAPALLYPYCHTAAHSGHGGDSYINVVNLLDLSDAGIGEDVWCMFDGASRGTGGEAHTAGRIKGSTVLFKGDVAISGSLFAERHVVEVDSTAAGHFFVPNNSYLGDQGSGVYALRVNPSDVTVDTISANCVQVAAGTDFKTMGDTFLGGGNGAGGVTVAGSTGWLWADDYIRTDAEIRTATVSFTDGDDAIEIEDGGYLKLTKGIKYPHGVRVDADDSGNSSNPWIKIASTTGTHRDQTTTTFLLTCIHEGWTDNSTRRADHTFIVRARYVARADTPFYYSNVTEVTVEPVHGNLLRDFDPATHIGFKIDSSMNCHLYYKSSIMYTTVYANQLGGNNTVDDTQQIPGFKIETGQSWVDDPTLTVSGKYATKKFDKVLTAQLTGSAGVAMEMNSQKITLFHDGTDNVIDSSDDLIIRSNAGAGDITLDGAIVFNTITTEEKLAHNEAGANDTFLQFPAEDQIILHAGGVDFLHITEDDSQDKIEINPGSNDVDFIVRSNFANYDFITTHAQLGIQDMFLGGWNNSAGYQLLVGETEGVVVNPNDKSGESFDFTIKGDSAQKLFHADVSADGITVIGDADNDTIFKITDGTNTLLDVTDNTTNGVQIGHATIPVKIIGDLEVGGTFTKINTTNLFVKDPVVVLGEGTQTLNSNGGIAICSGSNVGARPDLVWGRVANDTWGAGTKNTVSGSVTTLADMTLANIRAAQFDVGADGSTMTGTDNSMTLTSAGNAFFYFNKEGQASPYFSISENSGDVKLRPGSDDNFIFIAYPSATQTEIFRLVWDGTAARFAGTKKLEFGDTGTYINQSADGKLAIVSDNEVHVTATKVGIGTTSPEKKLHVQDGSAGSITAIDGAVLVLESNEKPKIHFQSPGGYGGSIIFGSPTDNDEGQIDYDHGSNRFLFKTGGVAKMAILGDNVGIGVTDPDSKLEVLSTSVQQKWSYDADSFTTMTVADSSHTTIATGESTGNITLDAGGDIVLDADGADIIFKDGGVEIGRVTNSSSDMVIKQAVNSKDIIFQQDDGNEICRMSNDRRLYFYDKGGEYISSDGTDLTITSGGDIKLAGGGANVLIDNAAAELNFVDANYRIYRSGQDLMFRDNTQTTPTSLSNLNTVTANDNLWDTASGPSRGKTNYSVSIDSANGYANQKGSDVWFYVKSTDGTRNQIVFGNDLVLSSSLKIIDSNSSIDNYATLTQTDNDLIFKVGGTEQLRIDENIGLKLGNGKGLYFNSVSMNLTKATNDFKFSTGNSLATGLIVGDDNDGYDRTVTFGHATIKTTIGIDDSQDRFAIHTGATLADNSDFEIDASGNVAINNGNVTLGLDADGSDRTVTFGHATLKTIMGIDDSTNAFVINTDDAFDATLANNSFTVDANHDVTIGRYLYVHGGAMSGVPTNGNHFTVAGSDDLILVSDNLNNGTGNIDFKKKNTTLATMRSDRFQLVNNVDLMLSSSILFDDRSGHEIKVDANSSSGDGFDIKLIAGDSDSGSNLEGGDVYITAGDSSGNEGSTIRFAAAVAGASSADQRSSAEKMRIHSNGYVGIGTASPTALLHIAGTAKIGTSLELATGATVTGIDNGALGSSATLLATQGAIKTYVDAQVDTVDTLAELTDTNITTPADASLLLYDTGTSTWRDGLMSGDATLSDTGVLTISKLSGGDIGVGISSPASAQAASSLLHIHDTIRATIQLTTHPGQINNGGDLGSICFGGSEDGSNFRYAAARILGEADGQWSGLGSSAVAKGQLSFQTADSGDVGDLPTARMTIKSDGKIGIGATDPGALLEVRGPTGSGAAAAGVLQLSTAETSVVDTGQLGRIEFLAPKEAGGTDAILVGASIHAEADDTFAADNNETELVFSTATSAAASERMRITSDGKVGIGTSSPIAQLEVIGNSTVTNGSITVTRAGYPDINSISSSDNATHYAAVVLSRSRGTLGGPGLVPASDILGAVQFLGYDGSQYLNGAMIRCLVDGTAADDDMPGRLEFHTTPDGNSGSLLRMTIKNDGKVGIGTATPSSALEVNGLVTATYYKSIPCGADCQTNSHVWLPFSDTYYAQTSTTSTHWAAYTYMAPCNGTLVKVKFRTESAAGSTTVKLYRITAAVGGSMPAPGASGTTAIETETITISADTEVTATFSPASMTAGQIYGLAINPTNAPNMTMASAIITLDWSTV